VGGRQSPLHYKPPFLSNIPLIPQLHSVPLHLVLQFSPHPPTPLYTWALTPSESPSSPKSTMYLGIHSFKYSTHSPTQLKTWAFTPSISPSSPNSTLYLGLHSFSILLTPELHCVPGPSLLQYPPHPRTPLYLWVFIRSITPSCPNSTLYLCI